MRVGVLLACLIGAPAWAQPAVPCTPLSSTWTFTTTTMSFWRCAADGTAWTSIAPAGGGLPAGSIILSLTTCPSGYEEATELNGKTLVGTLAANKDVGTTGGADAITPQGVNTLAAVADHASHTHTYTQVPNHTHGFTDARGATTGGATTTWSVGVSASDTSSTATALLTANPGGGVATGTTAGPSATLTHQVTQPTFTGTQFDNRSAYVRVIFCRKT